MIRPTNLPKFGLLVFHLSTSQVLAQAPVVRSELHQDVSKPPREFAVNPPAMPSRIRDADELEMLALTLGFKNIGRGGKGRA